MARREGHGWWPYLVPLFCFLLLLSVAGRLPPGLGAWVLPLQVLLPAGLFLHFLRQGAYPELRGYPDARWAPAADFAVGALGGAVWMAPYVLLAWAGPGALPAWPAWLRPSPEDAFDPASLGASLTGLTLSLRCIGYGLVTPFVEELFVRSFLCRYAEVFDTGRDFRDVPIGHYDRRSLLIVAVFFTASHMTWEWPVALVWILGTQLWFYWRRNLAAMVMVHAGSNLSIFAAVWLWSGHLVDRAGQPIDLWFFL